METKQKYSTLLQEAENHLSQLSPEHLHIANQFLAYLEQQEKSTLKQRKQEAFKAFQEYQQYLDEFKDHKWSSNLDSVELIRQMREGDEYRD